MFADEHRCAPMREHHQDESEGSRTPGASGAFASAAAGRALGCYLSTPI
jgi:hypothetical protein